MATWTKAEWATAALGRLGIVAVGQAASAEDQLKAESKADSIFAQLRRSGLVPFSVATIPEAVQDPIEAILADKLASTFGVTGERRAMVAAEARVARRELSSWAAQDKALIPIEVDDF